jgi:hypothetical protein
MAKTHLDLSRNGVDKGEAMENSRTADDENPFFTGRFFRRQRFFDPESQFVELDFHPWSARVQRIGLGKGRTGYAVKNDIRGGKVIDVRLVMLGPASFMICCRSFVVSGHTVRKRYPHGPVYVFVQETPSWHRQDEALAQLHFLKNRQELLLSFSIIQTNLISSPIFVWLFKGLRISFLGEEI